MPGEQDAEPARTALAPVYGALADLILEVHTHGPGPRAAALCQRVADRAVAASRHPAIAWRP